MVRQPDENRARKLEETYRRLIAADEITLDPAGRLTTDGTAIDAAPDQAAIYDSLLRTGTIPGIATTPAAVGGFDAWMLAAAAVGTATGKSVPITVDSIAYYNRILGIPEAHVPSATWTLGLLETTPPTGERFVDHGGFAYTRAEVFSGCVTWLDVPSLTWMVGRIDEVVDFAPLPPIAQDTDGDGVADTVTNIAGFAQLADDVRAVINHLHEHEVIPGFFMDPVFGDSCADQQAGLTDPAVAWTGVPAEAIQTATFPLGVSAYLPWGASTETAQLQLTITAADGTFGAATDVQAVATGGDGAGASAAFELVGGALRARWPSAPITLEPGGRISTSFDLTIAAGAPAGRYDLTLDYLGGDGSTVRATDEATVEVLPAAPQALWTAVPKIADQGTYAALTARVFNPDLGGAPAGQPAVAAPRLRVTIDAPEPFAGAGAVGAWSDAVAMPLTLDGAGDLVGTWPLPDPLPVPYDTAEER